MKIQRRYILIFLCILTTGLVHAQHQPMAGSRQPGGTLQGVVLDSSSALPLEYVSIALKNSRTGEVVTGGISDQDGSFFISNISPGTYTATIEFIGFEPLNRGPLNFFPYREGMNQNLGRVSLIRTNLELAGIDVQGNRPLFTQTIEKKIFNVEKNSLTTGGSALDALRQVPGVDVDIDGNISVRGNANVTVLIDGKPSTMTGADRETLLENIPADNIRDIEVITNPSAKYDPDGMAGILNLVLKENRLAGFNGTLTAQASSNGSLNGSGQVNYRQDKVNVFLNLGSRNDVRGASGDNYRETTLPNYSSILDQRIDGNRGGNSMMVKSGVEYYWDKLTTFGLSTTLSDRSGLHDRIVHSYEVSDTAKYYFRTSDHSNTNSNFDYTLSFERKFAKPLQTFTASAQVSDGTSDYSDRQRTTALPGYEDAVDPDVEKSSQTQSNGNTTLQADYVHPLGEGQKLEFGYKGILRSINTDYSTWDMDPVTQEPVLDDGRSNHFIFHEAIHGAYSQITLKKGPVGFQVGLRGEAATSDSELKDTGEKYNSPYFSLFPSTSFSLGSAENIQVQASYSRRINRPSSRQLNPNVFQWDPTSLRMGNPLLKPEYIDVTELNLSRYRKGLTYSFGLYYRRTTDKISHNKYLTDEGVTVMTYDNYNQEQSYGMELILSGALSKSLRLMASGNLYTDEINASNVIESDYNKTSTGYMGRVTGTWIVTPSTEVMITGFYRSPRDIPFGRINSMSTASLSVKRKFLQNKLALSLQMQDVFNTMGFGFKTRDSYYYQESTRKFDSQIASISLEYRFGKMEDRDRKNRRNGNREDAMGDFEIE